MKLLDTCVAAGLVYYIIAFFYFGVLHCIIRMCHWSKFTQLINCFFRERGGKKKSWKRESRLTPPSPPEFPFFQIIFSFPPYESLKDLSNISDSGMIKVAQNRHRKR
jgi:hypothetical protein